LSEANTIQAIPIPKNKSDVEAFLDDIFERALDTSDSLINPANANNKSKTSKSLQNRIKGGGSTTAATSPRKQLLLEIQSWDDVNSLNDYSLDSSLLYSTMTTSSSVNSTTTTTTSSSFCCDDSLGGSRETESSEILSSSSETAPAGVGLIIPNKEYEYTKMLRMFLGNKNLLSQLREETNDRVTEERLIYSISKSPSSASSSSAKNSSMTISFPSSSSSANESGYFYL